MIEQIKQLIKELEKLDTDEKVSAINEIRQAIHNISPFKQSPVDFVKWVKSDLVHANDYNPNSVAPPEMKLLEHSIISDGYTQPIVTWPNNGHEVVDGFHRHRVGKESEQVSQMIMGYLPIVELNAVSMCFTREWPAEPHVGRVANGVAARVDRLSAIGNGQVPRVAATAFEILS